MKKKIEDTLVKVGIPCGNLGFKYITDALLLLQQPEWKCPQWSLMYKEIAKANDTTPTRVERGIRYAFERAREVNVGYDTVEHYIGFANCQNGNTLALLNLRIKQETEGGSDE